jgi:hypothetical protein
MKEIGVPTGAWCAWSLWGEATFKCVEGKIPVGMIFVPHDRRPHLMGQHNRRDGDAAVQGLGSRSRAVRGAGPAGSDAVAAVKEKRS